MITEKDVEPIQIISADILNNLDKLEDVLRIYENEYSNNKDFDGRVVTSAFGLIGLMQSHIKNILKFNEENSSIDNDLDTMEKKSIIQTGLPYVLEKFTPVIERLKELWEGEKKEDNSKICINVLSDILRLKEKVHEVKKNPNVSYDEAASPRSTR
jgi:hypothetical protein